MNNKIRVVAIAFAASILMIIFVGMLAGCSEKNNTPRHKIHTFADGRVGYIGNDDYWYFQDSSGNYTISNQRATAAQKSSDEEEEADDSTNNQENVDVEADTDSNGSADAGSDAGSSSGDSGGGDAGGGGGDGGGGGE